MTWPDVYLQDALAKDLKTLLIESLEAHAPSTDQYCRLLNVLDLSESELESICNFLCDHERSIHSWQNYHLWLLLSKRKYKNANLLDLAITRINSITLKPEVPAVFIYLRCIGELGPLQALIPQFHSSWPYYHQRAFLLATSELEQEILKPLISSLGSKLKGTVVRARPHFVDNIPIAKRELTPLSNLYDEISPYD